MPPRKHEFDLEKFSEAMPRYNDSVKRYKTASDEYARIKAENDERISAAKEEYLAARAAHIEIVKDIGGVDPAGLVRIVNRRKKSDGVTDAEEPTAGADETAEDFPVDEAEQDEEQPKRRKR